MGLMDTLRGPVRPLHQDVAMAALDTVSTVHDRTDLLDRACYIVSDLWHEDVSSKGGRLAGRIAV